MSVCEALHKWAASLQALHFPFDKSRIPLNGIYILYEQDEMAHGENRIVRVGTHTGHKPLPSRMCQHFLIENKDRSIFRKNIGRALLNRDTDPFLSSWELDRTSQKMRDKHGWIDLDRQIVIERAVSEYIRKHFSFAVIRVNDKAERLSLESKMISIVANVRRLRNG